MQKIGKIAALFVAAILLVVATVFGTMAYLQDTDTNTNTFTVGKVIISMTETNVDGKDALGADNSSEARDIANEYHVVPGETYTKDPTIVVEGNSEPAYVYMTIDLDGYTAMAAALPEASFGSYYTDGILDLGVFCNLDTTDWDACGAKVDGNSAQYRFVYKNVVDADAANLSLTPLFTEFTIPDTGITNDNISAFSGMTLTAKAYAIQSSGFADYNAAWSAGFGNNVENFDIN